MKPNSNLKKTLSMLAAACMFLSATASHAALSFNVYINTSSLLSSPASASGPFSLDFQFNDGGVLNNNTATITSFNYNGGSATGSAFLSDPGVTGNISSTVTFNNSAPFQELYQTFTPGASLSFAVNLSTAVDGIVPDLFSIAILDSALQNITTNGFGDSLVQVNLDSASPTVAFSSGTGNFSGVAATPEPSRAILLVAGLAATAFRRRRSK